MYNIFKNKKYISLVIDTQRPIIKELCWKFKALYVSWMRIIVLLSVY